MKKVLMRPLDGRPVIDRLAEEFAPGYEYPDLSTTPARRGIRIFDNHFYQSGRPLSTSRDSGSET